jgi:hypothetical protein
LSDNFAVDLLARNDKHWTVRWEEAFAVINADPMNNLLVKPAAMKFTKYVQMCKILRGLQARATTPCIVPF